MRLAVIAAALTIATALPAEARTWRVRPTANAQNELQNALIQARPGDTIALARGRFVLTAGLSLDVDRVTIRGEGNEDSILDFTNQTRGAEGLLITSDRVMLRDFAVENARGDGIKARDCHGITFRSVRAEWTGGPKATNGAYGLYPVNCDDVLIQDSVARGASDAGIYVGQSRNIIVRDNHAEFNVAGIEIENSYNADVFGNTATHNTGGILIFDLPGLPQQGGHDIRVFENQILANNTPNFAPEGNIVATVPTGTGVLIMANRNVVVFENDIADNASANVIITSYRNTVEDARYNALPRNVLIRNNRFGNTGFSPAGELRELARAGVPMPDVLWDGATTYIAGGTPHSELVRIVVRDNRKTTESGRAGIGSFLSLGITVAGSPLSEAQPNPAFPPLLQIQEPAEVRIRN